MLDESKGFEDLGSLGRRNKFGSHSLVIMIRELYKNRKFPYSYYFTGSRVKRNSLTLIIKECIEKLLKLGLVPTSMVCDQDT